MSRWFSGWLVAVLLAAANPASTQPRNPAPPAATTAGIGSAGLRAILLDLICSQSTNDMAFVSTDRNLKSHLLETSNPYLWVGLTAQRLRRAELDNIAGYEAMTINESAENAVQAGPSVWETHWMLAVVRVHQRRFPEAKRLIARSVKLGAPASAAGYINAKLASALRDAKGAERALRDSIGVDRPQYFPDSLLQMWLGSALKLQNRPDDATIAFKAAEQGMVDAYSTCLHHALYEHAETLLLYKGDAVAAQPLIAKGLATTGNNGFAELRNLVHYVGMANGSPIGSALFSAEEAALELAKYPVGVKVLPALLRSGQLRNVDVLDGHGNTLLMLAAYANRPDTAEVLLKAGAKPDRANPEGRRALGSFCAHGSETGVRLLLDAKANAKYRDRYNETPLAAAIGSGNASVVRLILPKVKPFDKSELAGLVVQSAYFGMTEVVKELVTNGAMVNPSDGKSMPPLIAAILSGNRELVAWLLEHKADARVSFMGRSASDFARDTDDPVMIQLVIGGKTKTI